jgi:ribosomal protein S18 acetylase RimI-like enzyme
VGQGWEDERFEVVTAAVAEVEQIAPLFDAYRQFYGQPPDLPAARAYLLSRLETGESTVLLARERQEMGGEPLGFVQLYPTFSSISLRRAWILNDLFVAPVARRWGVAQALLAAVRSLAMRAQAGELTLQTAVDNRAAQALYESMGWRRDDQFLTYVLTL